MIYDISPPLTPSTAVWPGDSPLEQKIQLQLRHGDSVDLSTLVTTVHIGAHADAPSHYHREGKTIEDSDLEVYIGKCLVLHRFKNAALEVEEIEQAIVERAERVLIRTVSGRHNPNQFPKPFAYFSESAMDALGRSGVRLVGIDTPSVDHYDSRDLLSHQCLYRHGMRNLEGLDLSDVPEGSFELIALPLRLVGFDASPVRAILRSL